MVSTIYIVYIFTARNEVCEGYVFTGVCLSTGRVPGQVPPGQLHIPSQAGTQPPAGTIPEQVPPLPGRYTHPGRYTTTPGRYTPWEGTSPWPQCMLGYGQQAGGTHPTGMHSCLKIFWTRELISLSILFLTNVIKLLILLTFISSSKSGSFGSTMREKLKMGM